LTSSNKGLDQALKKGERTMSKPKRHDEVFGEKEKWAYFRFSVIGPLLAAPPVHGQLTAELENLAGKMWRQPISGEWRKFGFSTIERWYYRALAEPNDPVGVLARKVREDCGAHPSVSMELGEKIRVQYRQHPSWSYQLHADNLAALVAQEPKLGKAPSYPSVLRFMQAHGLIKRPRRGRGHSAGVVAAEQRFEDFEIRSYESQYVNALWHCDFHHGSLKVLLPDGQWAGRLLAAVCSRTVVSCRDGAEPGSWAESRLPEVRPAPRAYERQRRSHDCCGDRPGTGTPGHLA
jgi:hypothetical protein